jgi:hypothetical protein
VYTSERQLYINGPCTWGYVLMSYYNGVSAGGSSRMHNGNNYSELLCASLASTPNLNQADNYYYRGDSRDADPSPHALEPELPSKGSPENGLKLWRAAKAGQLPRVRYLLKSGADIGYRCDERATTPLHQAALNGHKEILKALLEAGAKFDDEDSQGATALHMASGEDIAMALITAGADVDHEDREGKTPGRRAFERQATAVVEAIISSHADRSKIYHTVEDVEYNQSSIPGNSQQIPLPPQHLPFRQKSRSPPTSQQGVSRNPITQKQTAPSSSSSADKSSDPRSTTSEPKSRLIVVMVSMLYRACDCSCLMFAPQELDDESFSVHYAMADRQASSEWTIRKPRLVSAGKPKGMIYKKPRRKDYYGITLGWTSFGFMLDPQTPVPSSIRPFLEAQRAKLAISHNSKSAEGAFLDYVSALHSYSFERIASNPLNHPIDIILIIPSTWSDEAIVTVSKVRLKSVKVTM